MNDLPNSWSAAKAAKSTHYFTGVACKAGHVERRATRNGECVACAACRTRKPEDPARKAARVAVWRSKNKAWTVEYDKQRRTSPAVKLIEAKRKKSYRQSRREQISEYNSEYARRNAAAIAARRAATKDQRCAYNKKWRESNGGLAMAAVRKRQAAKNCATPPWFDASMQCEVAAKYREAQELSAATGLAHHVDHIVPLRGKTVSGLHVPWNLQVIPALENLRKGSKLLERERLS